MGKRENRKHAFVCARAPFGLAGTLVELWEASPQRGTLPTRAFASVVVRGPNNNLIVCGATGPNRTVDPRLVSAFWLAKKARVDRPRAIGCVEDIFFFGFDRPSPPVLRCVSFGRVCVR